MIGKLKRKNSTLKKNINYALNTSPVNTPNAI